MPQKPTYEELKQRVKVLEEETNKHKQAEEALQKSEEWFRLLYERAPLGYQSLDKNGHFLEVNQAWLDTFGYSREEVIGQSFGEFLHPDWVDHFKENFHRFKAVGEILGVEFEMIKKDGSFITVSFNGKIGFDKKGEFKQTHCILQDITKQRRYEEKLKEYSERLEEMVEKRTVELMKVNKQLEQEIKERQQSEEALQESEALLKKSQAIAHTGSWELDLVANRLTWSDEVYRMFGLRSEEFYATYEAFLDTVHPDDRTAVDEAYSGSLREGRDTYEIEHRIVRRDSGEIRVVHEKCEHIRDESDRIVRSVGMVQDITERKRAEEERERLINELQKAMKEIKTLRGILPLCSFCKKIRDDKGYWEQVDVYIHKHSQADISHGICPECAKEHYPDF